jgi:hypothetical protein
LTPFPPARAGEVFRKVLVVIAWMTLCLSSFR